MPKNEPEISLPLLTLSARPGQEFFDFEENRLIMNSSNCIRIKPQDQIPADSYAIKISDDSMAPVLPKGAIGIFSSAGGEQARENIFLIGIQNKPPVIRKLVKNDDTANDKGAGVGREGNSAPGVRKKRKSFMATTPLHIPDSQVSPIPGSTHGMIFFRALKEPGEFSTAAAKDVIWMHPLVSIWQA